MRREEEVKGEAGPNSVISITGGHALPYRGGDPTGRNSPGNSGLVTTAGDPIGGGDSLLHETEILQVVVPTCHEWSLLTKEDPLILPMAQGSRGQGARPSVKAESHYRRASSPKP